MKPAVFTAPNNALIDSRKEAIMWTVVNQVFASHHGQNAWAHLANGNAWRRIAPNAADGVTNVFVMLVAAKANGRQAYVVLNGASQITDVYL